VTARWGFESPLVSSLEVIEMNDESGAAGSGVMGGPSPHPPGPEDLGRERKTQESGTR